MVTAAMISAPPVAADPIAATATVLKVVDGDTIDIRDDVRGRLRVRILGIDTPETKKPGYTVGCWGPEATEFAKIDHGGAASCARDRPDARHGPTGMAAHWPTLSGQTAGTIRSRLHVQARRSRTCTTIDP